MKTPEPLHQTAQDFLDLLGLPAVNPATSTPMGEAELIDPNKTFKSITEAFSLPVRMLVNTISRSGEQQHEGQTLLSSAPSYLLSGGPLNDNETWSQNVTDSLHSRMTCLLQTVKSFTGDLLFDFQKVWPAVEAASQLFFRLFAPAILILSSLFLILIKRPPRPAIKTSGFFFLRIRFSHAFASTLAIVCSGTIATDAMYIQEFGKTLLLVLHCATCCVIVAKSPSQRSTLRFLVLPLTALVLYHSASCNHDLPTDSLAPGFYYDARNPIISNIVQHWPQGNRVYSSPTPWALNGDTRTGIPFFVNNIPEQHYVRRYVPSVMNRGEEHIILDIAFPTDGIHRKDKPIYFVLCGLVGGSQEGYVKDLVARKRADGHTIAVMVARGLMDSTISGEDLLLFSNTADAQAALTALRKATGPDQIIAGVGFSMGAIAMTNYVAQSGTDCKLDVAVGISGALDTRRQFFFRRSRRLWQPLLVKDLRDIIASKFMRQLKERLTPQQIKELQSTTSVTGLDDTFFTRYHGFRDIFHYYSEMGGMGDMVKLDGTAEEVGRIGNVSIPLFMVHALDDPIGEPRTLIDPSLVVKTGSGNVLLLVTEKGGHVGWPQGWNPRSHGWSWMSNVASTFVDSANKVLRQDSCSKEIR